MEKTYRLKVAGLERELPICPLNEKMSIAAFIMFSDVELTVACALFGGAFLVICDTAARLLWSPAEIPVGIITSCLGSIFFLWLLIKGGR